MVISFAHTKTDKTGDNAMQDRHLYANPHMPEICVVTSLARFLLANPSKWDAKLFQGAGQYNRFHEILHRTVQKHRVEIVSMGMDPDSIGVHSIHKGAATFVCNGTEATVSFAAVCQRAGWSMGDVKDRYIHHDAAGDNVVGRVVAGLNMHTEEFCSSAPLFVTAGGSTSGAVPCSERAVRDAMNTMFHETPARFQPLARHLMASVFFHYDFHQRKLHRDSRFRGSMAFRMSLYRNIARSVCTCYPWSNIDGPWRVNFTGLTPLAIIYQQMQLQRSQNIVATN